MKLLDACSCCDRMENAGFITLMKSSENLEYLEVKGCAKVHNDILIKDAIDSMKIRMNNKVILKLCIRTDEKPEIVKVSPNLHLIKGDVLKYSKNVHLRNEFGFYDDYYHMKYKDVAVLKKAANIFRW